MHDVTVHDVTVPNRLDEIVWPRRTERLTLRRTTPDDIEAIRKIRARDGTSDWLTQKASDRTAFDAHFRRPERLSASLVVELDGAVIGDLMFRIETAWTQAEVAELAAGTQAELGWVIDPAQGGQGLATEAVRELLRIGFEDLGLRRITADCFADNTASWRLMERVGMRREAHTRSDSLHRSGRWLDGFGYAILAEDWQALR